jgi:hypothetical protein
MYIQLSRTCTQPSFRRPNILSEPYSISSPIFCRYVLLMQELVNRLSIGIIPNPALETARAQSPDSHWMCSEDDEHLKRIEIDDVLTAQDDSLISADVQVIVAEEVADWLESQKCDEFWMPRSRQPRPVSDILKEYSWLT